MSTDQSTLTELSNEATEDAAVERKIEHLDKPYQDRDVLYHLYHVREMSQTEVAERLETSPTSVLRHMKNNNIAARSNSEASYLAQPERPYTDYDTLYNLYHEQDMSMSEIGRKFGVTNSCISYQLHRLDIEIKPDRKYGEFELERHAFPYPSIRGDNGFIPAHRLIVIADGADPHEVFDPANNIHHKNGCKLDNRPSNLQLISLSEHGSIHGRRGQYTFDDMKMLAQYLLNPTQFSDV